MSSSSGKLSNRLVSRMLKWMPEAFASNHRARQRKRELKQFVMTRMTGGPSVGSQIGWAAVLVNLAIALGKEPTPEVVDDIRVAVGLFHRIADTVLEETAAERLGYDGLLPPDIVAYLLGANAYESRIFRHVAPVQSDDSYFFDE